MGLPAGGNEGIIETVDSEIAAECIGSCCFPVDEGVEDECSINI